MLLVPPVLEVEDGIHLCLDLLESEVAHAAEDNGGFEWQITAIILHALPDLSGQFSRGCEYEGPDAPTILLAKLQALQ